MDYSKINLQALNINGVKVSDEDIEKVEIPDNVDRDAIFQLFAMNVMSQLQMIVKVYNTEQKIKFSKKRFPFPLKMYCDLKKKILIMGTENKDFPTRQFELNNDTKRMFVPFFTLAKLANEDNWVSTTLWDTEKSVFLFSNKTEKKYGY